MRHIMGCIRSRNIMINLFLTLLLIIGLVGCDDKANLAKGDGIADSLQKEIQNEVLPIDKDSDQLVPGEEGGTEGPDAKATTKIALTLGDEVVEVDPVGGGGRGYIRGALR